MFCPFLLSFSDARTGPPFSSPLVRPYSPSLSPTAHFRVPAPSSSSLSILFILLRLLRRSLRSSSGCQPHKAAERMNPAVLHSQRRSCSSAASSLRRRRRIMAALVLVALLLQLNAVVASAAAMTMTTSTGGDGVMITEGDLDALEAIRVALEDPRGALSSWNRSSSEGACQGKWEGIKCAQGQVIVLQLVGKGLSGTLSPEVAQLVSLRKLSLHHNAIYGPIPSSIATLPSLRGLYLHHNNFSGTVPSGLASSPLLQSLDLSYNQLSGPIPADLAPPPPAAAAPKLFFLDLSFNNLSTSLPPLLFSSLPSLRQLNLHHNSLDGPLPASIASDSRNLTSLDISHNRFSSPLPPQLGNLTSLRTLDVSFNSFNGSLPSTLSLLRDLTSFNCSYNNLTGPVPRFAHAFNASSFLGNPGLCGYAASVACPVTPPPPEQVVSSTPSSMPVNSSSKKRRFSTAVFAVIVAGSALAGLLLLCLLLALCCLVCCRGRQQGGSSRDRGDQEEEKASGVGAEKSSSSYSKDGTEGGGGGKLVHFDPAAKIFTADGLLCATAEVVGKSTYGTVYKATFEDGSHVAVKRLREGIVVKGQRDFEAEVNSLAKLRHPNLLSLRSYYWGPKDEKLLIYDFMPGGSLAAVLHARGPDTLLDWNTRLNIAAGAARGLEYLHNVEKTVHGNLTSSNILLDSNMNAKLSDFGLARLMTTAANASVIATASALGYRAPELTKMRKASTKSDVYSFGVVLLELLTGKSPGETATAEQTAGMDLPDWVASVIKDGGSNISEIFDLELMRGSPALLDDDLIQTLNLAMRCVAPGPASRPSIDEVVAHLQAQLPSASAAAS